MSATPQDYQVAIIALTEVVTQAIKDNVPEFLMGQVKEHQDLIDQVTAKGGKAVVDAVDANRAKQDSAKGMD